MKKIFRANLYFLIIVLLEIFMPFVLIPMYRLIGIKDIRLMLVLNHTLLFIVPAIIYVIVTKCNIKETFRFKLLPLKDLIFVIMLGFICVPIMGFFGLLSSFFFKNNIGNLITSISGTPYLVLLAIIAIMPAITEEITLRGIVLSGYNSKSRFKSALVIGLFFGIFHLDVQQFLYAAVLGFILAYTVRVTGSIFASMIMHFIINGTSITVQKLANLIGITSPKGGADAVMNLTFYEKLHLLQGTAINLIIASVLAYLVIKKLDKWGKARGVREVEISDRSYGETLISTESKEKILDWPFIVTIIVYIIFMIIKLTIQ